MEFDKSRIYSAVNADELKPGDRVIVADDMSTLKEWANSGSNSVVCKLTEVQGENHVYRFIAENDKAYSLAYLIERAENCTNCGEGKWDAEHNKILCDPVHYGNGNVIFRNHEIEVCNCWKPIPIRAEKKCDNCGQNCEGWGNNIPCSQWKAKDERECTDCKHIDWASDEVCLKKHRIGKGEANYCSEFERAEPKTEQKAEKKIGIEKHYRPFKDVNELLRVWGEKIKDFCDGIPQIVMPLIWVKEKVRPESKGLLINSFYDIVVGIDIEGKTLDELFDEYTFLDGSPCGVEE